MFRKLACVAFAATLFLTASCSKTTPVVETPRITAPDPAWTQLISAHSTGAISRSRRTFIGPSTTRFARMIRSAPALR